jgi:hypothetical protein
MAELVYAACALASFACAGLLWRLWRVRRTRLLAWTCASFTGLALNGALMFVDLVLLPAGDLRLHRAVLALASVSAFVYGFIEDM